MIYIIPMLEPDLVPLKRSRISTHLMGDFRDYLGFSMNKKDANTIDSMARLTKPELNLFSMPSGH